MKINSFAIPSHRSKWIAVCVLLFTGCAAPVPRNYSSLPGIERAEADLKAARCKGFPSEIRAGYYLDAAATSARQFKKDDKAIGIYNSASQELAVMLRSAREGALWGRTRDYSVNGIRYHLSFSPMPGGRAPSFYTGVISSAAIKRNGLRTLIRRDGIGGPVVAVHQSPCPAGCHNPPFELTNGLVSSLTAVVQTHGTQSTISLVEPWRVDRVRVGGRSWPVAYDYSSAIAFYPRPNPLILGLMGLTNVEAYSKRSGLFMLEPYDPKRIPVIFIHGLVSVPSMWINDMNEILGDPVLHQKYQCWAFSYPTGNPVGISSMMFREQLRAAEQKFGLPRGVVLIGHSMGGLVSRMQATDSGRALWDANLGAYSNSLYQKLPPDNLIKRALLFQANPKVKRIVFICTPHRGSQLALSSIGSFAMKLISLPGSMVSSVKQSVGNVFGSVLGKQPFPNSITSLSSKNKTLLAMDRLPIKAPFHSIIGDRGRGDTPNSSDGVVPYWSSHLNGSRSELIVPGPHGSHELPETVEELKRILLLHLKETKSQN